MIVKYVIILSVFLHLCFADIHRGGILYPRESETRQVVSLDGLWNFALPNTSNPFLGFEHHWYKKDLREVSKFLNWYFSEFTLLNLNFTFKNE